MSQVFRRAAVLALSMFAVGIGFADDFSSLDGNRLSTLVRDPKSRDHKSLVFRDLEALPALLRDSRSALLLVRTDQGNLARMLVSPAFRKRPPAEGRDQATAILIPLLLVERFEVFDGSHPGSRISRGRDLMLFPGFQFDLDTGQVVPEGLGGDLKFVAAGPDDGRLCPLGTARLLTPEGPLTPAAPAKEPTAGRGEPRGSELNGRYRLLTDGRQSGLLALNVEADGTLSGTFRSDASGSDYPVAGKIDAATPRKARFTIQFPRSRQEYEGVLWSEGKYAISGLATMVDHPVGFVAVRQGTNLNLDEPIGIGVDGDTATKSAAAKWCRVHVDPGADRYQVDGVGHAAAELTEVLAKAREADPLIGVLISAPETVAYSRVRAVLDAAREAGLSSVRLSAKEP